VAEALAAAALFGVATPAAKLLLPGTGALALAALLYVGAGVGLAAIGLARRMLGGATREATLRRADLPASSSSAASSPPYSCYSAWSGCPPVKRRCC